MGHRHHHVNAGVQAADWLASLVDTFEQTERLGDVPCDARTLSAAMHRLECPAAHADTVQTSPGFELQH